MGSIEPYRLASDPDRRTPYYLVRYRRPDRRQTTKRGFESKKAAQAFLNDIETDKQRGEYIDHARGKITIAELGPKWLARQTHLKPSSYRPLEIAWRVHVEPAWGRARISDVDHTAVQDWVSELGAAKSATTVKRAYGVLFAILEESIKDKRLRSNPAAGVKTKKKAESSRVFLNHQQVHLLAGEAGSNGIIVLVLAYTGLRWGEMAGLRVGDVDLKRRRLSVEQNAVEVGADIIVGTTKSHARRSVPFPQFLTEPIKARCAGRDPAEVLFPSPDGGHLRRTRTDPESGGWFAGAVTRSGVPRVTPHDLRHTAASIAISAGANVKAVQRMLGHKSAAMTLDVYGDLFDDDLDAVAVRIDAAAAPHIT